MSWVFFTLGAVVMQTFRNALQSKLSAHMSTSGVTLSRFLFAPPIALIYLLLLYTFSNQSIPEFTTEFILIVLLASVMQIFATSLMVILFKQKNFAIGAGLAKSEALVAGVLGTLFFGSQLNLFGWVGILIGAAAIFVLSGGGRKGQLSFKTVLIGLACGTCFALTSLYVREASHMLQVPFPHSAAWVLLWVLCIQTSLLVSYIAIKDRSTFSALKNNAKMTFATSATSCFGSICWFSAMALQHVAYVKTLGQIEVLLTILIATFWLKNKVKQYEIIGLLLIATAAILVMWA
ncbi:MAG: DMT family transporter [Paraglaciecola sp.]|uniref:DMT family transporter n=1 Tax=Paraglaciecola sp. TaxID=1920173 RepID=UPI0032988256